MSVDDYLAEDGSGPSGAFRVADLVSRTGGVVSLLILLESPHVDELIERRPVVGSAGKSGLEFLLSAKTGESLGNFVKAKHDVGDWRIAIMNVSIVPLQKKAFVGRTPPSVSPAEWEVLRRVRTSKARSVDGTTSAPANRVSEILLTDLQARIDGLTFGAGAAVVAAGPCAQRFARGLQRLPAAPLNVHHPSYGNWMRHPKKAEHIQLRTLFGASITALPSP